VLLPWNKTVKLVIDADQITARTAFRGPSIEPIATPVAEAEGGVDRYDNIAAALRTTIAQVAVQAPPGSFHSFNIIIADSFAFYDVLEIDARLLSPADLNRAAGLGLSDTLGLDASELTIRCSVQKGGQSVVVCGIATALLDAVKHEIKAAGYGMNRLEPAFAEFLNRHRSMSNKRHALIAWLKDNSLMLGLLRNGNWQAFATERVATRDWTGMRDCCDAFCSRTSIIDYQCLPILFDADIDAIPPEARERWSVLPVSDGR
jgi:hypothetical protein